MTDESEKPWIGAAAIAKGIFGDETQTQRVYYFMKTRRLPAMRIGGTLMLFPSTWRKFREEEEARNSENVGKRSVAS